MKKKQGMSREEFIHYYETVHTTLARKIMPPLDTYRRNYIVPNDPLLAGGAQSTEEDLDFDVITEAIYESRTHAEAAMKAFASGETSIQMAADEENFSEPGSIKAYVVEVYQSPIPWRI